MRFSPCKTFDWGSVPVGSRQFCLFYCLFVNAVKDFGADAVKTVFDD